MEGGWFLKYISVPMSDPGAVFLWTPCFDKKFELFLTVENIYRNTADSQCCVNFRCIAK